MDVYKSLEKIEREFAEAKTRWADGLIGYHEMLRHVICVMGEEYHDANNEEFDEIEFEQDKDAGNIDEDWRNE